jgi:hypothetical protein
MAMSPDARTRLAALSVLFLALLLAAGIFFATRDRVAPS